MRTSFALSVALILAMIPLATRSQEAHDPKVASDPALRNKAKVKTMQELLKEKGIVVHQNGKSIFKPATGVSAQSTACTCQVPNYASCCGWASPACTFDTYTYYVDDQSSCDASKPAWCC